MTRMCAVVVSEVKDLSFFIDDDVTQNEHRQIVTQVIASGLGPFHFFMYLQAVTQWLPGVPGALSEIEHRKWWGSNG